MEEKTGSKLSAWLDKIETDSWQLELILSGFVVFLLLAGLEPYHLLGEKIAQLEDSNTYFGLLELPYHAFRMAYYILIGAIIFHVFLRGLWISTIGLRSVSGDIEWDTLNLSPRFQNYLQKQIPSFDHYIQNLEKYCSVFFAYTFLLVFSILAGCSFLLGLIGVQVGVRTLFGIPIFSDSPGMGIDDAIMILYVIFGFIYLIDFLTLSWLKKFKWLSKVYYPFYRFFGWITFAHIYRPIYYNLVDNKLGRRLAIFILPLGFLIVVIVSLEYHGNAYISSDRLDATEYWYLDDSYEDIAKENTIKDRPSIHAQTIKDNHIKLFVPYLPTSHEATYKHLCPDLEPGYFTGLKLRGGITMGEIRNQKSNTEELLTCAKQLWRVTIDDSTYTDVNFRFYHHPIRMQEGLLAVIPIHHLDNTEHFIKIDRQRYLREELKWWDGRYLWFYKS